MSSSSWTWPRRSASIPIRCCASCCGSRNKFRQGPNLCALGYPNWGIEDSKFSDIVRAGNQCLLQEDYVKTAIVAVILATAIVSPSNAQNVPASSNLDAHQAGPRTEVIRVPVNERAVDHYMRQGTVFIPGLPCNARAYDYQMRRGR